MTTNNTQTPASYREMSMQELGHEIAKDGLKFDDDKAALAEWMQRVGGEANGLIEGQALVDYIRDRFLLHYKLFGWKHDRGLLYVEQVATMAGMLWTWKNAIPVEAKTVLVERYDNTPAGM